VSLKVRLLIKRSSLPIINVPRRVFFPGVGRGDAEEPSKQLAKEFSRIVRERLPNQFNGWLRSVMQSRLKEFVSFACGLGEDHQAVMNALRYEWSNGQLHGLVNRLKLIERQVCG
jgi:transposase